MVIRLEIIDAIESRARRKHSDLIAPCLTYQYEFWQKAKRGRKRRKVFPKAVFTHQDKRYRYFHTGLVPDIIAYCTKKAFQVQLMGAPQKIEFSSPHLLGTTFREDQIQLIQKACENHRGVIQAPTGSGKTILQMGFITCLPPNFKVLILTHTIAIVQQTYDRMVEKGFESLQKISGGTDRKLTGNIIVATMQSFVKINPVEYRDYFQCVIVDEAHHISKPDGTYGKILSKLKASIRLGFTATPSSKAESQFTLTGLLGPIIGQQTIGAASNLGILAKPKLRIIKTAKDVKVYDTWDYPKAYDIGIVKNMQRNALILQIVKEYTSLGKSVLIFVSKLKHGELLQSMAAGTELEDIPFVRGDMETHSREQIKRDLITKERLCVISTTVWKEGVDIPNLDVVVNACGGASEIALLQIVGRGLRKTGGKEEVIIVDFFDPSSRYFISHFGERLCLYFDNNWM